MNLIKYLKELEYMKYYILVSIFSVMISYSLYYYLEAAVVEALTDEDKFFEWMTVLFFLASAFIGLHLFRRTKNIYFLLFFVFFFFAAGEEISWGQRLLGFETPEAIKEKNVQQEFTLHNMELFNQMNLNGEAKSGLSRFLEMNFLFRIGTLAYGILLPILVFHNRYIKSFTNWLKIPVPPVSVGVFFFLNWITYRTIYSSMDVYKSGGSEIFECIGALVLFLICLFFLLERKKLDYIGADIKEGFENYPYREKVPDLQR